MAEVKKNGRTKRLSELEAKIKDGVCVVGESLHQIHELELYLDEHDNWNSYCKTTFGWTGAHCYQLIKNVKTLDNVSTIVDTNTAKTLKNDHLRELGKVPDAKQAEVAAEVFQRCESENRQPTAKDIKKVAAELIEPQPRPTIVKPTPPPEAVAPAEGYEDFDPPPIEEPAPNTAGGNPLVIVTKAIKSMSADAVETVVGVIVAIHPSLRRKLGPQKTKGYDTDFETFWDAFPPGRKSKKMNAYKAWTKAIKSVDALVIIDAAAEYAASDVGQGEYVSGPEPWLNGGCWDDDRTAWMAKESKRPTTFQEQKLKNTIGVAQRFLERGRQAENTGGHITHAAD